jgi:hypothetical protein
MLRTTNQASTNDSVTAADHRWCCQLLIRRPATRPYVHATYAHSNSPIATRARALNLAAASRLPCISEYSIRKLPHPGQSIPNNALVGHTGSGPCGVVGSPTQIAAHASVVPAATISGAPILSRPEPRFTMHPTGTQNIRASIAEFELLAMPPAIAMIA